MKLKLQHLILIWIGVSISFMFANRIFFSILENAKIEFPTPN